MSENKTINQQDIRLWQLISPALPIGAYAYSAGLEYAVEADWVRDEATAANWILGQVTHNLSNLDVPIFKRLYEAWRSDDFEAVSYWNDFLLASRESSELRLEDQNLGAALVKVLLSLKEPLPEVLEASSNNEFSFAMVFSFAATRWGIDPDRAAEGLLWAWAENQVSAALKIIPLGQSSGQRILFKASDVIGLAVADGFEVNDDEIGFLSQGMAIASALHETQYTRLFRS